MFLSFPFLSFVNFLSDFLFFLFPSWFPSLCPFLNVLFLCLLFLLCPILIGKCPFLSFVLSCRFLSFFFFFCMAMSFPIPCQFPLHSFLSFSFLCTLSGHFPPCVLFKAFVSFQWLFLFLLFPILFISLTLPSLASISPDLSPFSRLRTNVTQTRHRLPCCLGDQREQSPEEEEPDADATHPRAARKLLRCDLWPQGRPRCELWRGRFWCGEQRRDAAAGESGQDCRWDEKNACDERSGDSELLFSGLTVSLFLCQSCRRQWTVCWPRSCSSSNRWRIWPESRSSSESRYITVGVYLCEYKCVFVNVYLITDCCLSLLASSGGPGERSHTAEDDEAEQDHE